MEPALLRRHGQRGAYDVDTAKAVFDDCFLAHVAYVDDEGMPACMPMIALLGQEEGDDVPPAVYLHGHPSAKLMELVRRSAREEVEEAKEVNGNGVNGTNGHGVNGTNGTTNGITNGTPGHPVKVCITSTKVDGLVLSSAPNGHTFNYRAATVHGTCFPVTSKPAKAAVMRAVTNKIVADRWDEVNPVASLQVGLVCVVRVRIDRLSVKTRAGTAGIQPRNAAVDGPDRVPAPWTGVVPLWEQLGTPVASGLSPGTVVSESLQRYLDERNARQAADAQARAEP